MGSRGVAVHRDIVRGAGAMMEAEMFRERYREWEVYHGVIEN